MALLMAFHCLDLLCNFGVSNQPWNFVISRNFELKSQFMPKAKGHHFLEHKEKHLPQRNFHVVKVVVIN